MLEEHKLTSLDLTSYNNDSGDIANLAIQNKLAGILQKISPGMEIHVFESIEEAIAFVTDLHRPQVFVTGSLHLVGGVLSVLQEETKTGAKK